MEKHLNDVYVKIVNIDAERGQRSTYVLKNFVNIFVSGMLKEEPSLISMSPRVEFLGSYFEDLKICRPNEFDINIVLTLPHDENDITMTAKSGTGSMTSVSVPADATTGLVRTWCSENGEISAGRFRRWMIVLGERVLKSRRTMRLKGEVYKVTLKDTGVAMTAVLADEKGFCIFVDVVIVFQFSFPKIPFNCGINSESVRETGVMTYFLVPIKDNDWRMTMSSQEKNILKHRKCNRAMKLVKYICDVNDINIYSYVTKTLLLRSNDKSSIKLTDQVIAIMETFREYLFSGIVPDYWFHEDNLIGDVPKCALENWCKKLTKIIKYLQSDLGLCSATVYNLAVAIKE